MYSRVYVEITNICNMSCSFCHGHSRAPRRMTEAEFSRVLDALEGYTKYVYYHLMGEPLTHPSLPKFLSMAAQRGYKSIITTNGTLLESRGAVLIAAGLHKVNISLHSFEDGDNEAHERYVRQCARFADTASRAGVIVVFRLWNNGHDGGINDKTIAVLRDCLGSEWAENARGARIRERIYLEWGERFGWPDKGAPVQGDSVFCYGMRDHFGILCDGRVVPCCLDSDGAVTLGNVFEQSLAEILGTERARAIPLGFEQRRATEELCRRCAYAQRFTR